MSDGRQKGVMKMKGYKAFNSDLTCRGFQFEIGETYEHKGEINPCESGFHFCKNLVDCYEYYDMSDETRICKVEAVGNIKTDDNVKYCTDKITILSEIKNPRLKSNLSATNSGYCNSGNYNSGNYNSGYRNSGYCNSGNRNSGYCNSGNCNSGDWNLGHCNSGNYNSGYCNSGNCNSGDCNSGYWNSGNWNSGIFNTYKNPKIKIFDKESDWTIKDWIQSKAKKVMNRCPYSHSDFISKSSMTEGEKEKHPEYKTIGGYVKIVTMTDNDRQIWWDALPEEEKEAVKELPNFDADKFKKCTGITVE
jgi:hypothetical protein